MRQPGKQLLTLALYQTGLRDAVLAEERKATNLIASLIRAVMSVIARSSLRGSVLVVSVTDIVKQ